MARKKAAPTITSRAERKRARRESSPRAQRLLAKLRSICLALPETEEVEAWGHPTFRVRNKIFAGFDGNEEGASLGVKTSLARQEALVSSDDRFRVSAYVGKHGWVTLDLTSGVDWEEVTELVRDSYRRIAPARLAREVEAE